MRTERDGLRELRQALSEHGGTLAESLRSEADDGDVGREHPGPPQLAAAGPRAGGRQSEYELLLEMILEGSLLHYGAPRVVRGADPDLALLLGAQTL